MNKKIIGVGNAITDLLVHVDDNFITDNKLIKSSMNLISLNEHKSLSKLLEGKDITVACGGSLANSFKSLSYLGFFDSYFIGSVGDDIYGKMYLDNLNKMEIQSNLIVNKNKNSGVSIILVTPDGERTMCTYLGIAPIIKEEYINETYIKDNAKFIFIEGYLWDNKDTINTIMKLLYIAKKYDIKVIFSLSDQFCVQRHQKHFQQIVSEYVGILFANDTEFRALYDIDPNKKLSIDMQINNILTIITKDKEGVFVMHKKEISHIETEINNNPVDNTGAGDFFAGGFLYGLQRKYDIITCAEYGHNMAKRIIKKLGTDLSN